MRTALVSLSALLVLAACGTSASYPPDQTAGSEATMAESYDAEADRIRLRLKGDRCRQFRGGR